MNRAVIEWAKRRMNRGPARARRETNWSVDDLAVAILAETHPEPAESEKGPSPLRSDAPTPYGQGLNDGYARGRAETLAEVRAALPELTFADSWGVDAVYVGTLMDTLDRLAEGGGS